MRSFLIAAASFVATSVVFGTIAFEPAVAVLLAILVVSLNWRDPDR